MPHLTDGKRPGPVCPKRIIISETTGERQGHKPVKRKARLPWCFQDTWKKRDTLSSFTEFGKYNWKKVGKHSEASYEFALATLVPLFCWLSLNILVSFLLDYSQRHILLGTWFWKILMENKFSSSYHQDSIWKADSIIYNPQISEQKWYHLSSPADWNEHYSNLKKKKNFW